MTTDCLLNFKFNTWKVQAQAWGEHVVYRNCFWHSEQFLYTTCSSLPDFCMLPWFSVATQNRFSYVTNLHNILVAVPKFVPIQISEFDVHNTQGHDSRNTLN